MSINTTAFYGLGRDFAAMIPQGHNAFTAHTARSFAELDPAAQAYELKKQAQREAWRKRQDRKNELNWSNAQQQGSRYQPARQRKYSRQKSRQEASQCKCSGR